MIEFKKLNITCHRQILSDIDKQLGLTKVLAYYSAISTKLALICITTYNDLFKSSLSIQKIVKSFFQKVSFWTSSPSWINKGGSRYSFALFRWCVMIVISQIIDTLKLHYYHDENVTRKEVERFNKEIDVLIEKKESAMNMHHSNNEMRFIEHTLLGHKFKVMAVGATGFSVVIKNKDVSIFFKKHTLKTYKSESYNSPDAVVRDTSHNPVIKVEFRSSFLVRYGYLNAIEFTESKIVKLFMDKYKQVVSEIHLATDVQDYEFMQLDEYRFKTKKKKKVSHEVDTSSESFISYSYGRKYTGFTIGSGDDMLRVYNKSFEIKQKPDKAYIRDLKWKLNKDYDENKTVWRIEVQYRREKLKELKSDIGVLDTYENVLNSIHSLWKRAVTDNRLLDMSDNMAKEHLTNVVVDKKGNFKPLKPQTRANRFQRIRTHPEWKNIQKFNAHEGEEISIYDAPRTGSRTKVDNAIKGFFSTLINYKGELTPENITESFEIANEQSIKDKGLSLSENASLNSIEQFGKQATLVMNGDIAVPAQNHIDNYLDVFARGTLVKFFEKNKMLSIGGDEFRSKFEKKIGLTL